MTTVYMKIKPAIKHMKLSTNKMTSVAALPDYLQFVSDSQDVESIRNHIGESASGYDAFFVATDNGDYTEVWGIVGIIPNLSKLTSKLL